MNKEKLLEALYRLSETVKYEEHNAHEANGIDRAIRVVEEFQETAREMEKVRGIFCLNSNCEHYFEDNCMKILETDTVNISEVGMCADFKAGKHIGYADDETGISGLASAT